VQVITGSHDKTVKLWDIRAVRPYPLTTLTYHKKSVRAMAAHPTEYSFATAGADNIKK
jgi:pleiotropic regulator 1